MPARPPDSPARSLSRRTFVQRGTLGGVGLLTFMVGGCEKKLTPAAARLAAVPFRTLDPREVRSLETLGDVLLPGSAAAGLAHYIDHQLSGPQANSMLMIKYLGVPAPFTGFYQNGLAGLDAAARALAATDFSDLDEATANRLAGQMATGEAAGWSGPPAGLFYFVLRSDAIDVVYGTPAGFAALGIPYLAHIEPPSRWGE